MKTKEFSARNIFCLCLVDVLVTFTSNENENIFWLPKAQVNEFSGFIITKSQDEKILIPLSFKMTGGIQEFYKNKTIFITGGSGFMGKVLLEKLMYSCSDLKEIFILMRPKRGKSGAERVQDFANIPVSSL